ncbi:MAG: amidophosphoribosyltransferase [Candidatus Daviesbacteria bacterium]|nr:amidophosphoribosyltransferase [Candidatus Daviesbacteria bacterium]
MRSKLREKCGIFAVFGKDFKAARLVHPGLWALQHRGQESSGIAASDGKKLRFKKGPGLVAHVYSEEDLKKLTGHLAIGQNRYSTSGDFFDAHAQPIIAKINNKKSIALAHNGNLPSVEKIKNFLDKKSISTKGLNDSDMMTQIISYFVKGNNSLEKAIGKSWPYFTGSFCILAMDEKKIVAARDRCGIRPLCIGKLNSGYIFASESCALDIIGAKFLREVKPGEMVVVDEKGIRSIQVEKGDQKLDVFEFVYFARPDSIILGKSVDQIRQNLGKQLAKEHTVKGDLVIPVPDSAIPAAIGFSRQSQIPYYPGIIKNRYVHRTFISPEEHTRDRIVQLKLNPMKHILKNKRIIVVDDSIVRGTTCRQIIKMVRDGGAKSVHLMISSPPVRFPDFYGINTPNQKELIASYKSHGAIAKEIGVDSLHYLSYKGLIQAIGLPESKLCMSCFTGKYPIDIGERSKEINFHPSYAKI